MFYFFLMFSIVGRCRNCDGWRSNDRRPQRIRKNSVGGMRASASRMDQYDDDYLERLREQIIGCAIEVHRILGPGLLESIYVGCLCLEFARVGLSFETDVYVPVMYKGDRACHDMKIDILVEDCVIVEVKAVAALHPVHSAQVLTYLKLADRPNGLLLNFNATSLRAGLKKLVHPDLYTPKKRIS